MIASDVNPLPKSIEKLASALGSKAFFPEVSLSNVEKAKIINEYKKEIKGSHQKDALAAGLKAFRYYHELFLKVEETLTKMKKMKIFDKVVERMVKTGNENIVDTIKKIIRKKR